MSRTETVETDLDLDLDASLLNACLQRAGRDVPSYTSTQVLFGLLTQYQLTLEDCSSHFQRSDQIEDRRLLLLLPTHQQLGDTLVEVQ